MFWLQKRWQQMLFPLVTVLMTVGFIHFSSEVALAQTVPVEAQSGTIEKSMPQFPPTFAPPPEIEAPKITNGGSKQDRDSLKPSKASPKFFIKKIKLSGNTVISDEILMPIVDLGEGKDVDLTILNTMANKISALYSAKGYLLARAFVPKQEIVDGIVEIIITEGRINEVLVQGSKKLSKEKIAQRMKIVQEEGALQEQTLERVLLELNELMGVNVTTVLKPGALPGTSDLVLEVTESKPYAISFDSDNFGSQYTGEVRFGFSATHANIFTLGDQFSARYTRSNGELNSYSPFYTFPVNAYGTRIKLSYSFSENELSDSLDYLDAGGESFTYGLEVSHLLHKNRKASFSARTGLNIKSSENTSGMINTTKDNLTEVFLGFGGNFTDSYLGRTFYDLKFKMGLREGDSSRALVSRLGGHGKIFTTNINLTRLQATRFLNSYFMLKFTGQVSNTRALSPFLYGVGGMGTVRGYPISAYSGDMGYNISAEYTVPFPWDNRGRPDLPDLTKILSFISFLEYGEIYVRNKRGSEVDQHITGAGGGLKVTIPKKNESDVGINFSVTYGAPVFNSIPPADGSDGYFYLNGMINY